MKQIILFFVLISLTLSPRLAFAQNEFVVNGHLENVEDGVIISLMEDLGNVSMSVVKDTVREGRFALKWHVEEGVEQFSLSVSGKGFPSYSLPIWAEAGSVIKVSGNDKYIYTWDVESTIPQQAERARFVNASREDWLKVQHLSAQRSVLYEHIMNGTQDEQCKPIATVDSIDKLSDLISRKINRKEIELLEQGEITNVGLERLANLALYVKYSKDTAVYPRVEAIYNRLDDKQKNSPKGKSIGINLFPPQTVTTGEQMIDADLYDLEGKKYQLSNFKNKFILLDFWSMGCGPCIMAMPEMKELAEKYKDRLVVMSLSIDGDKGWRKASSLYEITWYNLSDGMERIGIAAKYGVSGIPHYTLISPDGTVIDDWTGYGKGSLKTKVETYIE